MNKAEFEKWVKDMLEEYHNIDKNILIKRFGDKTYIAYDCKTNKIAISRCHPDDEFRQDIGIAIAYARCKGYEVPKVSTYKKFCELKNGDKFKWYSTITYLFIGKCYSHSNEIAYAIQNTNTLNIKQIGTAFFNKEVEMVE